MKKLTVRERVDRLNQKLKDEGKFWDKPKDDRTQIVFHKDNPQPKKNIDKDKMTELLNLFSQNPDIRLITEYLSTHEIIVNYERSVICPAFTTHFFEIKKDNPKVFINLVGNDIASLVQAPGGLVRIEINNKNLVIEVPNRTLQPIPLNVLIGKYKKSGLNYELPIMMGIDNENKEVFADLVELKHLFLAGQTGSGKSVFINNVINTFLTLIPNETKFILADGKRVELTPYNGLPQVLDRVILEAEMFFEVIEKLIEEKRKRLKSSDKNYPYIIVIIDTMCDFIYVNPERFNDMYQKLLVDADIAKIHVIACDSRISKDIYTPTIMSLMPTKLCFTTPTKDDSQYIIQSDEGIKLLGRGDVLIKKENETVLKRLQTPWVSDKEINELIKKIKY